MASTATATVPVVFQHHVPRAPLSNFVGLFWYWRGHEVPFARERILPMGTAELVIRLGSGSAAGTSVSGPQSESFIIERTEEDELIGIHFILGGVFPFLHFPCDELHGQVVTVADVWGERRANELICRLHDAGNVDLKFKVLEHWLLSVAVRSLKHHPVVSFAMEQFQIDSGLVSSARMAERVGFSQRHFIQLFRDEVGLTPKLFCRVQRFQQVIRTLQMRDDGDAKRKRDSAQPLNWTDVALSCGYFDQSHFNHDFRKFSGLSPTEYLALRTEHFSHVQVR